MQLNAILTRLQELAPLEYAESWDNVGLLVGDRNQEVSCVMTCLTLTSTTLREAIEVGAQLVVPHHPIPFKPIAKITDDTTTGLLLLDAIRAGIAIYSPHTAWDNAKQGINQQLAEMLDLQNVKPLQPFSTPRGLEELTGVGRSGTMPTSPLEDVVAKLRSALPDIRVRHTHEPTASISKIGIVCGSGGSMLGLAVGRGCNAMLTGEATYHQCLEAEAQGIVMIMIGHHASESFAMKRLAVELQRELPSIRVVTSENESSAF